MKLSEAITAALLMIGMMFTLSACDDQGPMEEAGEEVDDAADDAGDAMEDAGDEMEDAADGD